jgi:inner membrane protein
MDPISQGIIGSAAAQTIQKSNHSLGLLAIVGFLSGMAPDLDIFIRSQTDPLLFLEFHRQFTHSLIFIPIGGLLCASIFFWVIKRFSAITFHETWIYTTIGYGTHSLLDACTSYGTLLFWPFSFERVAWNNISIIDPLFTFPIIIFVGLSVYLKKRVLGRCGLVWALCYLLLGVYLNQVALQAGKDLADARGHPVSRIVAKPTFANLLIWKIVYESGGYFYTDGVRILPTKKIFTGEKIKKLDLNHDLSWIDKNSQQHKDINRFAWFSDDFLALQPDNPSRIVDIRYSMLPNEIGGLWGIEISKEATKEEHVQYITNRSLSERRFKQLLKMIMEN